MGTYNYNLKNMIIYIYYAYIFEGDNTQREPKHNDDIGERLESHLTNTFRYISLCWIQASLGYCKWTIRTGAVFAHGEGRPTAFGHRAGHLRGPRGPITTVSQSYVTSTLTIRYCYMGCFVTDTCHFQKLHDEGTANGSNGTNGSNEHDFHWNFVPSDIGS